MYNTFQSTLPQGERPSRNSFLPIQWGFQSTLPQGERRGADKSVWTGGLYFNPRSRKGSDGEYDNAAVESGISIHAPARGATATGKNLIILKSISIHAPARGATRDIISGHADNGISIHAPARGATVVNERQRTTPLFQSTLPQGERLHQKSRRDS